MVTFPQWPEDGLVAIDLETHDPDLKKKGPGVRTNGYSVGYALAFDGFKGYYAFGHATGNNTTKAKVVEYFRDQIARFRGDLVFANGLYDLDYMAQDGVDVPDRIPCRDVQVAEPLLDDNALQYGLDRLAKKYLGHGKTEELMVDLYGANFKEKMAETDGEVAATYAQDDADDTLRIYVQQIDKLIAEGLWDLFELETALTPMLLYMRRLGVSIDVDKTNKLSNKFFQRERELNRDLAKSTGVPFGQSATVWQNTAIAKAFDVVELKYPLSPTGKPSFRKEWLNNHDHELAQKIVEIRNLTKLNGTFLQNALLGSHVNGRIHTTFNQVRNDQGGAVTGRFSSKNPNLQQIPKRDPVLAPMIRGLFLPDPGHWWGTFDYSQIEYRLLVHYAILKRAPGSYKMQKQYLADPLTDYHKFVQDLVKDQLNKNVARGPIKNINFGLIYGMGVKKLAAMLGMSPEELFEFLEAYNAAIPFAKYMKDEVTAKANRFGNIKTILGRRRRFTRFESRQWDASKEDGTFSESEALKRYGAGNIKRAGTYKALNALIQGAAADLMKKAMLDLWRSGLCSCHGGPIRLHLTIHDELDFSFPKGRAGLKAFRQVGEIMEDAITLEIPVKTDGAYGKTWAHAKDE